MSMPKMKVVLTDHPWPDVAVEQAAFDAAGIELIAGPIEAPTAQVIEATVAMHDPHAILCCWAQVSAQAIRSPNNLRIVARLGVGLDNIAIPAATARGVWVTNVPDYCVEEVSDHAIAMLLSHWRGITAFDRDAKRGVWNPASANLKRTRNMTVGIIGYGRIGETTARKLAQGFGARVLVSSPSLLVTKGSGFELAPSVAVASIATIQAQADAIILHLPLTLESQHLVDAAFLAALKRKPLLINVSRGGLVDNAALIHALDAGLLGAAALDVVEGEPSPPAAVIGRADVIVTPHVAFSSDASLLELRQRCCEEVVRVLRGQSPQHPCNEPKR
jgi:phosphoglycerate dehydrogenase-like enzyme